MYVCFDLARQNFNFQHEGLVYLWLFEAVLMFRDGRWCREGGWHTEGSVSTLKWLGEYHQPSLLYIKKGRKNCICSLVEALNEKCPWRRRKGKHGILNAMNLECLMNLWTLKSNKHLGRKQVLGILKATRLNLAQFSFILKILLKVMADIYAALFQSFSIMNYQIWYLATWTKIAHAVNPMLISIKISTMMHFLRQGLVVLHNKKKTKCHQLHFRETTGKRMSHQHLKQEQGPWTSCFVTFAIYSTKLFSLYFYPHHPFLCKHLGKLPCITFSTGSF